MRWVMAAMLVAALGLAGCRNEKAGVGTSEYAAQKEQILAKARAHEKESPAQPGARPKAGAASPAAGTETTGTTVQAEYTYDPTGKRDPFHSYILAQAKEQANKETGPLEQFDISQLRVVAVVWDTAEPRALIADPAGRPYVIGEGAAVGKNEGRVTHIDDGRVVVKETYVDWLGERTTKDIELRLAGGDKGGDL